MNYIMTRIKSLPAHLHSFCVPSLENEKVISVSGLILSAANQLSVLLVGKQVLGTKDSEERTEENALCGSDAADNLVREYPKGSLEE